MINNDKEIYIAIYLLKKFPDGSLYLVTFDEDILDLDVAGVLISALGEVIVSAEEGTGVKDCLSRKDNSLAISAVGIEDLMILVFVDDDPIVLVKSTGILILTLALGLLLVIT
ncbi:hypothetical protein C1645_811291 [Glomus cerebriforme]|uniref:Uncharacterized protein n=1 Tax=Glomus cerebriforme TaxID=658196 RepID=A0A397TPY2_9GLOM|nr:hypothetical protein C1645_811291 [Glomus cerebriforme]